MSERADISRLELLKRIALPMGNLSTTLGRMLDRNMPMDQDELMQGLLRVRLTADEIYNFVIEIEGMESQLFNPKTTEVLRRFVAEKLGAENLPYEHRTIFQIRIDSHGG